ncbi:30S ribosomal protein S19 [Rozella allomycis CSF55]|uniref:30S ribosomal protein S19 n=1 Tax=Rozella allomycis (strain CSF55) TaxID=988480 RepID=A0A4P9YQF5_ROZAC|nr:30S ribosomal protein S19 [Rozella allomycis CSF55]
MRAKWKGPFVDLNLYEAIKKDVTKAGVQTYSRNCTIIPGFVGAKLYVHNGHKFLPLIVREEMVGMKLGALVPSITVGVPKAQKRN